LALQKKIHGLFDEAASRRAIDYFHTRAMRQLRGFFKTEKGRTSWRV
jgi:hypothetical protein